MNPLENIKAAAASIADKVTGENPKLLQEVVKIVQNMPGGVSGLLKQFQDKGLGHVVSTLTGKGGPQPISTDQIVQVFGTDRINALAAASGLDAKAVREKLATMLPKIVQQLSATDIEQVVEVAAVTP